MLLSYCVLHVFRNQKYLLLKYLLSIHYAVVIVLEAWATAVISSDQYPCPGGTYICSRRRDGLMVIKHLLCVQACEFHSYLA